MTRRVHAWRSALWTLVGSAVLASAVAWSIASVGHWLVVTDPLERADAIVVLVGHVPFRAIEAAALYRQGWAPRVWLTRSPALPEDGAMARLGLELVREPVYNRLVLERLGVPADSIHVLARPSLNTVQEVQASIEALRSIDGQRLIAVTSKAHSRRVRATFSALAPGIDVRVRHTPDDPFNPDGWWRRTQDALDVSREVFGLLNVWAGFPVVADRP